MTDYATSKIVGTEGTVNAGDVVTPDKLGITDEEYDELVEAGAISEEKPEDMGSFDGPPAQWATMSDEDKEVYLADEEETPAPKAAPAKASDEKK